MPVAAVCGATPMARLKTKWNLKDAPRDMGQTGSALAANIWRVCAEALLNMENERFETHTQARRLDVVAEFAAFATHAVDRLAGASLDDAARGALIQAVAERLAGLMEDDRNDAEGTGPHRARFIDTLNRRAAEYAECGFNAAGDGPSFTMRRLLGGHVRAVMPAASAQWLPDYIMEVAAPAVYAGVKRAARPALGAPAAKSPAT